MSREADDQRPAPYMSNVREETKGGARPAMSGLSAMTPDAAGIEAARRAKVNGSPHGTIAWSEHERAWKVYARHHQGQSAERINERGGFGIAELTHQLGHPPLTWEPDERTRFMDGAAPRGMAAALLPVVTQAQAEAWDAGFNSDYEGDGWPPNPYRARADESGA